MTKSMTEGNPFHLILSFSVPLVLGNLFQQLYNIVDTAIVGQTLGSAALAAVGSSTSIQFLILGFCNGLCQGFAIPVATKFGAEDEDDMQKFYACGRSWIAIFAVALTLVLTLSCPAILHMLRVSDEIYADAYAYLAVIFLGLPFTLLYNFLSASLRAIGDSRTPFYFLAFSAVLNIFLDFFCILVLHWGCMGAAIATVISQGISGILCFLLIRFRFEILHIRKKNRVFDRNHSGILLKMGLPMGLQFSITAIGTMVIQSANNNLGTMYSSAFAAAYKIKQLFMSPFDAFGAGTSTFLAQNYGAGKKARIHAGLRSGIRISVIYGCIACVTTLFLERTAPLLFISAGETEILDAAALYLNHISWFYPALGVLFTARMSIQGLGYSGRAMASGIVEMAARTLVAVLLVPLFQYAAITWADGVSWSAACAYLIPCLLWTLKKVDATLL